jgi:uncharacterized membrane protein YhhN
MTKPLLMPLIILYYVFGVGFESIYWLLIIALVFGWLGDIFLMLGHEGNWFMLGLGSFLIGHIFYIILYLIINKNILMFPVWGLVLLIPSIFLALFFYSKIHGKMGDLTIPTIIYLITIFTMSVCATLLLSEFNSISFLFVYLGPILFMISDGMIALDKFNKPIPKNGVYVMFTYGLAQLFIAQGILLSQIL